MEDIIIPDKIEYTEEQLTYLINKQRVSKLPALITNEGDKNHDIDKYDETKQWITIEPFLLKDRYIFNEEVFGGAAANIYICNFNNQIVIIKKIKTSSQGSAGDNALQGELNALTKIQTIKNKKDYVKIYDIYGNDKYVYIVMDYIKGPNLKQKFKNSDKALDDTTEILTMMVYIFRNLSNLHNHYITHGDIKPENIMYDEVNKKYILVDYGFANLLDSRQQIMLGTPAFVPHEKLMIAFGKVLQTDRRDFFAYNCLHDLWALGCIFYKFANGMSIMKLIEKHYGHYNLNMRNIFDFLDQYEYLSIKSNHKCELINEIIQHLLLIKITHENFRVENIVNLIKQAEDMINKK